MIDVNFIPDPNLYPDPSGRARRIIKFISRLRLWEGDFAGEYFTVNPFQEAIIRRIYGPCDAEGNRLVRIANIWIPRGNAKTTLASALGLAHFLGPEAEAGGQIIMAAADRGNAGIAFNSSFQMVQQDKILQDRVRSIPSQKEMHHIKTKSLMKAISTESYSKHGLNVSFFLADEIHAWPPTEARKLFKVISDSMVKRSNPLTVIISTAGEGVGGLAFDMWDYCHRVARGDIDDPSLAPIIFAAPEGSNWRNESVWKYANPGIDAGFVSIKELRDKFKRAVHFPTDAADFKRFHLNLWVEGSATPWIEIETYDRCEPRRELTDLMFERCWVGVDLSSVEDLTCVCAVFPHAPDNINEERAFDVVPMFFLPEESLAKKADRDKASYLQWRDQGYLTVTKGNRIDQKIVHEYCMELTERYEVVEFAVDRWNSTAFVTNLQDEGLEVVEFGQGFGSMAGPVKEIKSTILSGKFRHGGNPIMRMGFLNVVTEKDAAENEKFTKAKARGRIDGPVAAAEAIGRILAHEQSELETVYRGYYSSKGGYKKRKDEELELVDDGKTINYDILNGDMKHPLFGVMKERFERYQDRNVDRDDF